MSKNKTSKKKVVTTKSKGGVSTIQKKKIAPTLSRGQKARVEKGSGGEFIFGRNNYILIAAGAAIVLLGLLLMIGGSMPNDETWDPEIIYGFRITVLAPLLILVGLGVEVYAIFKK